MNTTPKRLAENANKNLALTNDKALGYPPMKTATLQVKGWPVPIIILDKRIAYGRTEYLCKPRNSPKKATWKNADAVVMDKEAK